MRSARKIGTLFAVLALAAGFGTATVDLFRYVAGPAATVTDALMRQGQTAQDAAEQVQRMLRRGRGGSVGPPVPPGSEPLTEERRLEWRRRMGGRV